MSKTVPVGNLVFVFALCKFVSINAKIALAERSPCLTAPLCNRAHIGSRLRSRYAMRPTAVWSAISFRRRQVALKVTITSLVLFLKHAFKCLLQRGYTYPNMRNSSPGSRLHRPQSSSGGRLNKMDWSISGIFIFIQYGVGLVCLRWDYIIN